jgi:hypothetical protein
MDHRIAQNLVPGSRLTFDNNFTVLPLETENSFLCVKSIELLLGFSEGKKGLHQLCNYVHTHPLFEPKFRRTGTE